MDRHIGFDDIPFTVLAGPDGQTYPDWVQDYDEPVLRIPGSGISVVQDMGYGLATWTVRLEVADMAAYRALRSRQKTTGTLTLYASYTSAVGRVWQEDGTEYEDLAPVELVRVGDARIEIGHEWIEAEAVFRAALDPLTGRLA